MICWRERNFLPTAMRFREFVCSTLGSTGGIRF